MISAKKEEDQVWKWAWILDGYTFCPFWSGIGYGFRGNYGSVWTYLSFRFQMNEKERNIRIWNTPWSVVVTNKRLVNNNHSLTFLILSGFNSFYTADYKISCSSSTLTCVCMYPNYSQLSPCGHPAITNTPVPGKNKLQTFDWNKLSLLRTLASEDTNSRCLQCPQ